MILELQTYKSFLSNNLEPRPLFYFIHKLHQLIHRSIVFFLTFNIKWFFRDLHLWICCSQSLISFSPKAMTQALVSYGSLQQAAALVLLFDFSQDKFFPR